MVPPPEFFNLFYFFPEYFNLKENTTTGMEGKKRQKDLKGEFNMR